MIYTMKFKMGNRFKKEFTVTGDSYSLKQLFDNTLYSTEAMVFRFVGKAPRWYSKLHSDYKYGK